MQSSIRTLLPALLIAAAAPVAADSPSWPVFARSEAPTRPRLVLFITVDQLRGDMPLRFEDRFAEGGFKRLLDNGAVYLNAHYRHSTTFTAVGHASLFTGGNPPEHGIAGNDWVDPATGQRMYAVEDANHTIIGEARKAHGGTSPRNLTSSTIGDEIVAASAGRSRIFSVSLKDRGAILPAGHLGSAYWYDSGSGRFVTSTYYAREYPEWVTRWNDAKPADAMRERAWTLLNDGATYERIDADDQPFEIPYGSLGRTFPHRLANEGDADAILYKTIPFTPLGDELTLDFVMALIDGERVGAGAATDLLAVSFSATDYVGHAFGPDSLEAEDNLLRLDRTIAALLDLIDERIGLERAIVVLSSDHGIDSAPEYRHALACAGTQRFASRIERSADGRLMLTDRQPAAQPLCCGAGRHFPQQFIDTINERMRSRFGLDGDVVIAFWNPSLYFDRELIAGAGLEIGDVERAVAEELLRVPGIAAAVTRTQLLAGELPDQPLMRRVERAFHPQRSGNIMIVQAPFWYLYHQPTAYAAMHGSPYSYDTHVPVIIMAAGVEPARIARTVAPEDIAPTLALMLGIEAPSGCVSEPLAEVVEAYLMRDGR